MPLLFFLPLFVYMCMWMFVDDTMTLRSAAVVFRQPGSKETESGDPGILQLVQRLLPSELDNGVSLSFCSFSNMCLPEVRESTCPNCELRTLNSGNRRQVPSFISASGLFWLGTTRVR